MRAIILALCVSCGTPPAQITDAGAPTPDAGLECTPCGQWCFVGSCCDPETGYHCDKPGFKCAAVTLTGKLQRFCYPVP